MKTVFAAHIDLYPACLLSSQSDFKALATTVTLIPGIPWLTHATQDKKSRVVHLEMSLYYCRFVKLEFTRGSHGDVVYLLADQ
jgi:hypothetical protein